MSEKNASFPRRALQARKRAKHKKPEFLRSESWRYSKLSESWRRPRGLDHKMRRKIKGWPPMVSTGYKGPKSARGLHPSGYREVLIHNVQEVSGVDSKTQAARIAHTVGKKKRAQIIACLPEKGVSRARAKIVREKKRKGRRLGPGSYGGSGHATISKKEAWMTKIRSLRRKVRELKASRVITEKVYTQTYRMAGSGRFESVADMERYLKAHDLWRKR